MLHIRRPSIEQTRAFLARQSQLAFTYSPVGATAATPPAGYVVDHTRIHLGQGEGVFLAAKATLLRWGQFELGWMQAWTPDGGIAVGTPVAVAVRTFGLWWLNACRVVYAMDDQQGDVHRWGCAYGTLPGHAESGEEQFLIEWNRADDSVWYDILAFSRPRHPLAKLGYPLVRRLQKKFGRDSAAEMKRMADDVKQPGACNAVAGDLICPQCGAGFHCAASASCWCAKLPRKMPVPKDGGGGCLCPGCLAERVRTDGAGDAPEAQV